MVGRIIKLLVLGISLSISLCGCASNFPGYQERNWYHDGYSDEEVPPLIHKIDFSGRRTSYLTIQTFWLLRASELTLEKGYDGFEILPLPPNPEMVVSLGSPMEFRVDCPDLNIVCTQGIRAPFMRKSFGNIHLLKGEIKFIPLRVFDAHVLKANLDKIKDNNCGPSAVANLTITRPMVLCPHDKSYLYSASLSSQ
jgi:hypothetical protein